VSVNTNLCDRFRKYMARMAGRTMSDVSIIEACCEIQHRRRVFGARHKLATATNGVPEKHNPARNRVR
jgi:hypothetical protein